jgi:hypothetical protein
MDAVQARNGLGIVVGGSPTFTAPLVVRSGVSIFGGFQGHPGWQRDLSQRPFWDVPTSAASGARLVGASATDVVDPTVISHVRVRTAGFGTASTTTARSNVAFLALRSPGLQLVDVILEAGKGENGLAGVNGSPPNASMNGGIGGNGGNGSTNSPSRGQPGAMGASLGQACPSSKARGPVDRGAWASRTRSESTGGMARPRRRRRRPTTSGSAVSPDLSVRRPATAGEWGCPGRRGRTAPAAPLACST